MEKLSLSRQRNEGVVAFVRVVRVNLSTSPSRRFFEWKFFTFFKRISFFPAGVNRRLYCASRDQFNAWNRSVAATKSRQLRRSARSRDQRKKYKD